MLLISENDTYFVYILHPKLSIWFFLFEIKRVLVNHSTIFKLTDLFIFYFFIQNVYADKKYFKKV